MSEKVPYYTFFFFKKATFRFCSSSPTPLEQLRVITAATTNTKKHDTCDTCVHSLPQKRLSFSLLVETVVCVSFYKF